MADQTQPTDSSMIGGSDVESKYLEVNDVRLHVVSAGDGADTPVVLLHGYPEFWYCWLDYLDPLVDAGYRVLVPDQRGYNLSDKPEGTKSYRISALSSDIAELITSTGNESAHVIGHDWGAAVAWDLSLRHPEKIDRVGIINVPHPEVLQDELTSSLSQMRKSWYMFFYQLPKVPEWYHSRNNFQPFVEAMQTGDPRAFSPEDFDRYRAAWSQAGALTAMINWYRALFRHRDVPPREHVRQPTLVIWGEDDSYLNPGMAPKSIEYCEAGRLERFPEASHWIHHEKTQEITDLLIDHLAE